MKRFMEGFTVSILRSSNSALSLNSGCLGFDNRSLPHDVTTVLFKLELTVRGLVLPHDYQREFAYGGPHVLRVHLRAHTAEEQAQGHRVTNASCSSFSAVDVNDENLEVFKLIEADKLIPQKKQSERTRLEYALLDGRRAHVPDISELPQSFRSYLSAVSNELNDVARRTVLTLRWRLNGPGAHQPFSFRGFFWSWSGEFWHPAPPDIRLGILTFPPLDIPDGIANEVAGLILNGSNEPLHHTLWREAWNQRRDNPKSAIVVGVAAAEFAVKYCISTLVPNSQWLAINLPMPPVHRILSDYLPTLPAKQTFNGEVKPPPKKMLGSLKRAVNIGTPLLTPARRHLIRVV
jgi:hypothetical protein